MASLYAKKVANDQNPIHDYKNDKFCIPGDLVFNACIDFFGLSSNSSIKYYSPILRQTELILRGPNHGKYVCTDNTGKMVFSYLRGCDQLCDKEAYDISLNLTKHSSTLFEDAIYPALKGLSLMLSPENPSVVLTSILIKKNEFEEPNT